MNIPHYSYDFILGVFETYTDVPSFLFVGLKQTHSKNVIRLTPQETMSELACADGIVIYDDDWKNQDEESPRPSIVIKTADCLPLLILGQRGVALLHAGWRGVEQDIFFHKDVYLLAPHTLLVGPAIGPCCYEVSKEFLEKFQQVTKKEEKYYLNLPEEMITRFKAIFPHIKVIKSDICTCCGGGELPFHSHRRNQTPMRNYNVWRYHA